MRTWLGFVLVSSVGLLACSGYEEDLGEISQGIGGSAVIFPCPISGAGSGGSPHGYGFQEGSKVFGSDYAGTSDTFLYEDHPTTNYGSSDTCTADGGSDRRNCLLRWSSLPIPTNVTVLGAALTLQLTDGTASIITLFKMTRAWDEGQATWQNASSGSPWGAPGARGSTDTASSVLGTLTGPAGSRTICLNAAGVAAVQDWVTNPSNNKGVLLGTGSTDGVHIRSSEFSTVSQRPKLTVAYTPD